MSQCDIINPGKTGRVKGKEKLRLLAAINVKRLYQKRTAAFIITNIFDKKVYRTRIVVLGEPVAVASASYDCESKFLLFLISIFSANLG